MRIYCLTFLFLISCNNSSNNQSSPLLADTTYQNSEANNSSKEMNLIFRNDTTIIHLKKGNVNLLDVRIDSTNSRELSIQKGQLIKDKIQIPTQEAIQGFAVNWIKETDYGFEISIEYGSRYYYQKDFRFYYENEIFVLKNVLVNTFDKHNSESKERYITKTDTLRTPVKLRDFKIENYL